jgi:hypothetical protein
VTIRFPLIGVGRRTLSAAVLAGLLCTAAPAAMAQTRSSITRPDQTPAVDRRAPADAAVRAPTQAAPSGEERDPANEDEQDPSRLSDVRGVAPARSITGANGETAEEGDPDPDVGDGAQRLAARRPGDGDLAAREPEAPRDGVVPVEQPQVSIDGDLGAADEMALDDPELEGVLREQEQLGRPIQQQSRFGPYQPVGVRVGSFLLFPTIETGISGSDNVFRSASNGKSDMFADVTAGATLSSNWSRHALEFRIQNARTYHQEFSSENDNKLDALVRGRLDISRRTNIVGDVAYSYGQESRGGVNTPTASSGERPAVIQRRAGVEANHRVNRLSLQLRGAVTDNIYGSVPATPDSLTGLVAPSNGNDRNYVQREIGGRAGWQFNPNLQLYADVVLNNRTHEAAASTDGILRNSDGYRAQLGVAFDKRGKLQGEASAGYASQTPDDVRLKAVSGFIYNGKLSWQPTGLTEVIVTATSDIGETSLAGSAGALTRTTGVEVRHALRRHIILVAGASYAVANFGGSSQQESSTVERLGLEYYLTREAALLAGYQHTNFETNGTAKGYEDNTVRVGMRVRQ